MRLIVARCEVSYIGRTTTVLPEAVRLLMCKGDGTFMVWADGGSPAVKPLNWMTPPTVFTEERDAGGALTRVVVRKQRDDERLEIAVAEVMADVDHELDVLASLEKEGLERELQELLADAPHWCGEGFRLVRREWPTDIGPVDLMCRDTGDEWIAVEIKRIATMEAVEQLTRYLERIRLDPAMSACRGVLVAKWIKPQARVLAASRSIDCVEIDVEVLRGNREPDLRLFAA
ncbi:MAG: endonuclease NucS [Solirubrobacteraceae bacterium]